MLDRNRNASISPRMHACMPQVTKGGQMPLRFII